MMVICKVKLQITTALALNVVKLQKTKKSNHKRKTRTMKKITYLLIIVSASIFLFSCSPQKRLNRLVALHPELSTTDTIRIRDTTIIPETRIDTAFNDSMLDDTVIFTKEKLTVKLHRMRDSVYMEAEYGGDTVVIERVVPVDRIVVKHTAPKSENGAFDFLDLNNYKIFILIGLGILFLLMVWRRYPR